MGYSSATAKAFVEQIGPLIAKHAKEKGYQVASPIIAQAICESAAGTSGLSAKYNNYFGLKAGSQKKGSAGVWDGTVANMKTKEEYTPGTLTTIRDYFRVYKNMEEGVKGYFEFLMYARYQNLKQATSPEDYLKRIVKDGYCTSTTYVVTCMNIIKKYDLERFDWNTSAPGKTPVTNLKSVEEVALEVIDGKWGTGNARRQKLEAAGYNYQTIQNRVNQILKK